MVWPNPKRLRTERRALRWHLLSVDPARGLFTHVPACLLLRLEGALGQALQEELVGGLQHHQTSWRMPFLLGTSSWMSGSNEKSERQQGFLLGQKAEASLGSARSKSRVPTVCLLLGTIQDKWGVGGGEE